MATLYITEYAETQIGPGGKVGTGIPMEPPLAEQTVAIATTSNASAAFNSGTRFVRLQADAVCSVSFETAPTATTTKDRVATNTELLRGVPLGQSFKVAVISNS